MSAYRLPAVIVDAEPIEATRVFCRDCVHLGKMDHDEWMLRHGKEWVPPPERNLICTEGEAILDPVRGPVAPVHNPGERNRGFDCLGFTARTPPPRNPKWIAGAWAVSIATLLFVLWRVL